MSQNLAGIGDMFMQMNDPATRAKAALMANQNALLGAQTDFERTRNTWLPQTEAAKIALDGAQAGHATAAANHSNESARGVRQINDTRQTQINEVPSASPGASAAFSGVPYKIGRAHV